MKIVLKFKMMRSAYIIKLLSLILAVACVFPSQAKKVDIYELSLDQNLSTPEIRKDDQAKKIQDYQYDQAVDLIKHNFEVELMRNNEVMVVNIPAEKLFAPNDTVLSKDAASQLKYMLGFLKNPGFYKVLLVMHSDNTGTEEYTKKLTSARVNKVFDWFESNGSVDFVVPYALGSKEPLAKNDSMDNRRKNRRLEIFIVPGDVMIEQAKRGAIDINLVKKK